MEISIVNIHNGIPTKKSATYEKVVAGLVSFGRWLNDVGLNWEITVEENTVITLEVFRSYNDRIILSCIGSPEAIQHIKMMVGSKGHPKMFYP
ncbi:MAG: hypothetical protein WCO48_02345 [Candidatus Taylorbacteria bacterium]